MRFIAMDFLLILRHARRKLRTLLIQLLVPHMKQGIFVSHRLAGADAAAVQQLGGKADRRLAGLFSQKPRPLGQQLFNGQTGINFIGATYPVVEPHEQLSFTHMLPVGDRDFRDHAARGMSDALDARLHAHLT